jgi:hypothetical protein
MQQDTRKFIIGGGLSGLIWSFYNPEYTIISPDIGGQLTHGVYNLTWVHDTPETKKLLNDLNLNIKEKITRIGYYYGKKVNDVCDIKNNEKIIKKKMSDWNNQNDKFEVKDNILSVPENFINTLDTDFSIVIKKLSEKANVINDFIVKITDDEIIGQNGSYKYEKLVSTIPSKMFWAMFNNESFPKISSPDLKAMPVTFVVTNEKPKWYDDKYEMIYIAEDFYFTRVSKRGDNEYTFEFTGIMPEDIFERYYGIKIKKYFINKFGRIHSITNKPPKENIIFLGRFAEWIHSSKIQHVIKKAIENND